eukprot:COSAG01_NODE_62317_length_285_cov_0.833333_1_plen_84_part_10
MTLCCLLSVGYGVFIVIVAWPYFPILQSISTVAFVHSRRNRPTFPGSGTGPSPERRTAGHGACPTAVAFHAAPQPTVVDAGGSA